MEFITSLLRPTTSPSRNLPKIWDAEMDDGEAFAIRTAREMAQWVADFAELI